MKMIAIDQNYTAIIINTNLFAALLVASVSINIFVWVLAARARLAKLTRPKTTEPKTGYPYEMTVIIRNDQGYTEELSHRVIEREPLTAEEMRAKCKNEWLYKFRAKHRYIADSQIECIIDPRANF